MAKFTVCVPGLLTTVQDRGRMGYAASGFSPSGVMDRRAFSLGNLLVGNAANAPAIEFAFAGPTLEFENDAVVAITGADFNPRLDEERAPMYQAFVVRAGQRLSMPAAERGVYGYLAIANGGVDVPRVMGSASTNLKCGLGGFKGRRFAFGDAVNFHDTTPNPYYDFGPNHYRNDPFYHFEYLTQEIRVVPGPQSDLFTSRGIDTFYKERYQVSAQTDRMGCRLDGPQIESSRGSDIISDGIALGSIQIPAQGTP
ncbi:MAG: biotin-dependent carboxyltransferase family protein, partial [Slackia isoflavoniconvertens]|nr:biotin-dependent carboxyltransferase family protein [Slackia isoflavoniconvertens]